MLQIVWKGPQASQILRFVGHAYGHYSLVLSAHAHNPAQYVGKGRQQAAGMELLSDINAAACRVSAL